MFKNNLLALIANLILSGISLITIPIASGPEGNSGITPLIGILIITGLVYLGYSRLESQGSFFKNLLSISVIGLILVFSAIYRNTGTVEEYRTLASHLSWHVRIFDVLFGTLNNHGEIVTSLIPTVAIYWGIALKKEKNSERTNL